jgi:hypothetical protein
MEIANDRIRNIEKDEAGKVIRAEIKAFVVWDKFVDKEVDTKGNGFATEKLAKKFLISHGLWKGKHNPNRQYVVKSIWKSFDMGDKVNVEEKETKE